jgi:hypothetical protein
MKTWTGVGLVGVLMTAVVAGALFAAEPVSQRAAAAWLGVQLAKPDPSITAHLPELPTGMGFVVRKVDGGGPAEQCGMSDYDVVWKFGDQLLVNEGQLAALLRLHSPGDRVVLAGFRAGQAMDFQMTLGASPVRDASELSANIPPARVSAPVQSESMRLVHVKERVASYTIEEGTIEVSKAPLGYLVRITAADGSIIYQGAMAEDGDIAGLSSEWTRRAHALRRGLDHQLAMPLATAPAPSAEALSPAARPAASHSGSMER